MEISASLALLGPVLTIHRIKDSTALRVSQPLAGPTRTLHPSNRIAEWCRGWDSNPRSTKHRSLSPAPLTNSGTPASHLNTPSRLNRAAAPPPDGGVSNRCIDGSDLGNALTPRGEPKHDESE